MRIGIFSGTVRDIDGAVATARQVAEEGFAAFWLPQIFSIDALTTHAVVGREVPGIELGTAVVPTYPRHPMVLAQQALTTQAASGGRLTLGIGLSHQIVVEGMWGYSFDKPARHMREYLSVLLPLLRGEGCSFEGETLKGMGQLDVGGADPVPVLLAALAPRMLELAGSLTDGTITWMTGRSTVESHIIPSISTAADKAGRAGPRVAVGLPVCVSDDAAATRERAARVFSIYGQLPSYRAMLDKEGAAGPADVAIVGSEDEVRGEIEALAKVGVTDFIAAEFASEPDEVQRTRETLRSLL